jgi:phosphoglycolate phosphatase
MIIAALREHGLSLPDPDVDRLLERFLGFYEQNIARESRPFEGAAAVLGRLRGKGARLAICTNKRAGLSNRLLAELGLDGLFAAVAGRDTFPVHKPHPGHLTGVVALAGGDMGKVVMIGDTSVDVATARAAGVPVVACSFGYSDVPIEALASDAVIASFGELEAAIGRVLANTGATAAN